MRQVLEIGLFLAVALAVLAFGGTAPQFFAITQVIVLILGILQLFPGRNYLATRVRFPAIVPFLLIALVLLQIVPLPISLAHIFGISVADLQGRTTFTITAAPYETVSQLLALVTPETR